MATTISLQSLHVQDGVLYAALSRPVPKWLARAFIFFVATLPLETLQVDGLTSEELSISKLAGFLFFAVYVFYSGVPLRFSMPRVPMALWGFLGYLVIYVALEVLTEIAGIRNFVMRLLTFVQFFVFFWLASDLLRDPAVAKKALLTLVVVCGVVATGTTLGLPGFAQDFQGRATAMDASPNHLAALMAYAAIIIVGFCIQEERWSKLYKLALASLILPLAALMVSSGSRAGIGALVIGMCFFFIPHRKSKRQMLAFGMAAAVIAGVLYMVLRDPLAADRVTETIQEGKTAGRGDIYAAALEMFREQPLVGWGGRQAFTELGLRTGKFSIDAHNFILYLLIEVGLVGAVPFLIAVGFCVRDGWRGRAGPLGLMPLALIMTLLAYNMSHTGIRLKVFWLFMAFAVAAASNGRDIVYRRVKSLVNDAPGTAPRRQFAPPAAAQSR